jgi:hypothetical protein
MVESFKAYRTGENHAKGKGWCLYIIPKNYEHTKTVRWFWFKDMMSLFAFVLQYPEGESPKE